MNIQENITKFTNLDANDSLSGFKGNTAQQFHGAYEVFYEFLKQVRPNQILEIGTALGGFTQFLKLCVDDLGLSTKILSYDIAERPWYKDIISLGVDVRVEDVFDFINFTVKTEVVEFIKHESKINGKVWNWHEIQDSDISEASDKNNLLIYNKETFENVAWTCRVKK